MSYNIMRYVGNQIGQVVREGLTRAKAMQLAADLNSTAEPGKLYCIERW
jgi:hypothetical protein